MSACTHRIQKRAWDSPGAGIINCLKWVLGTKLLARAARAPKVTRIISPASKEVLSNEFRYVCLAYDHLKPKQVVPSFFWVLGLSSRMHLTLTAHLHLDQWGYHTEQHSSWLSRILTTMTDHVQIALYTNRLLKTILGELKGSLIGIGYWMILGSYYYLLC